MKQTRYGRLIIAGAMGALVAAARVQGQNDQPEVTAAIAASGQNFAFKAVQATQLPNGAFPLLDARALNDAGVIVGNLGPRMPSDGAFQYQNGTYSALTGPLYKGSFTSAVAINNRGQVLLLQDPMSGQQPRYFVYDLVQKTARPIGTFIRVTGSPNPIRLQQITGMNDSGQFVGTFILKGTAVAGYGALAVGPDGSPAPPQDASDFTVVACPAQTGNTAAWGINNHQQVTGSCGPAKGQTHGFLYSNGAMTLFDYPGMVDATEGRSINDAGVIVGGYRLHAVRAGAWPTIGFLYDGTHFLPMIKYWSNGSSSVARSINNRGQAVMVGGGSFLVTQSASAGRGE